jgi:hypothetical protein
MTKGRDRSLSPRLSRSRCEGNGSPTLRPPGPQCVSYTRMRHDTASHQLFGGSLVRLPLIGGSVRCSGDRTGIERTIGTDLGKKHKCTESSLSCAHRCGDKNQAHFDCRHIANTGSDQKRAEFHATCQCPITVRGIIHSTIAYNLLTDGSFKEVASVKWLFSIEAIGVRLAYSS